MKESFEFLADIRDEKREKLEDSRITYVKVKISELGYDVFDCVDKSVYFRHNDHIVKFFPYTGWATGKSIKDGRGLKFLLKQLTKQQGGKDERSSN